jgi:type VI protein secretion system component VasK
METHPTDQNLEHLKAMLMMTDELGTLKQELSQEITLDERIPENNSTFNCPWDNQFGDVIYFR